MGNNVAEDYPNGVKKLMGLIDKARLELGDAHTGVRGSQEGEPASIDQLWDKLMMDSK